jgi:hypothetical protein
LIIGEAIRKENVTPIGIPASTNPKKRGMAEQEQNGVTIPSNDAITFPVKSDFPSSALRVFSGEKYERTIPTRKIISVSRRRTFGTSKIKNLIASVKRLPAVIPNALSTSQSVAGLRK